MEDIADELNRVIAAKKAIKAALESKGIIVADTVKIDEYAALIESL